MRKVKMFLVIIAAITLTGCTGFASLVQSLNERQVQSCLYYEGNISAYVRLKGVSAIGGFGLENCMGVRGSMQ